MSKNTVSDMSKKTLSDPQSEATFRRLFELEKNEELATHFVNHMLTTKTHLKFKRVSFKPSIRMKHAHIYKQENIIKLLCIDEKMWKILYS